MNTMDMNSMNTMDSMSMTMTATSTGGMSSNTGMSGMGGSMSGMDMGGMDMDMGQGSCKVSMLWNWNTIDACFLSKSWHITSRGMFAGSCIGVICLVLCLEFLRRIGREYDAFIVRRARLRSQFLSAETKAASGLGSGSSTPSASLLAAEHNPNTTNNTNANSGNGDQPNNKQSATTTQPTPIPAAPPIDDSYMIFRPTVIEQTVRAILHLFQFAVAYFIMLLAMYFNGYIIICIFIGAFLGSFIFSWEPLVVRRENDATAVTKCCG